MFRIWHAELRRIYNHPPGRPKPWWRPPELAFLVFATARVLFYLVTYYYIPTLQPYDIYSVASHVNCTTFLRQSLHLACIVFIALLHLIITYADSSQYLWQQMREVYEVMNDFLKLNANGEGTISESKRGRRRLVVKFTRCYPPARFLRWAERLAPAYFHNERMVWVAITHDGGNFGFLSVRERYRKLLWVNSAEFGAFLVLSLLSACFLIIYVVFLYSFSPHFSLYYLPIVAADCSIVLVLGIAAIRIACFYVLMGVFCSRFLVTVFKRIDKSFAVMNVLKGAPLQRRLAQLEASHNRFVKMIMVSDSQLVSTLLTIGVAFNLPTNILYLSMFYFQDNLLNSLRFGLALVVVLQFLVIMIILSQVISVCDHTHMSAKRLLPLQFRLESSSLKDHNLTLRAKLHLMRMHEQLHSKKKISWSVGPFSKVTRVALFNFVIFVYLIYFLMAIQVVRSL